MDIMGEEEYYFDLDTLFFENQELGRLGLEEDAINPSESSSPEAAPSSSSTPIPRHIVLERRRRQLVSDTLKALRSVVPFITKLDKESIIKDAIDYIQVLQEQEKDLERALTAGNMWGMPVIGADRIAVQQDDLLVLVNESKMKRRAKSSVLASGSPGNSSIEVMGIEVREIAEMTFAVTITCNKKRETMTNVCELFESLNLKVIKASITSISGSLLHTIVVKSEELNSTQLKEMMEGGIAQRNALRMN